MLNGFFIISTNNFDGYSFRSTKDQELRNLLINLLIIINIKIFDQA
jgi:hypothetical protein